jgi:hypothetical protein
LKQKVWLVMLPLLLLLLLLLDCCCCLQPRRLWVKRLLHLQQRCWGGSASQHLV